MTLVAMSWPLVAAGAVVIAALLFGLQRLRARPRVVRLANALLWAVAAQTAPRRVLVERFDRRLVYLLLLCIALLLWFAAARPELREAPDGSFHIFYMDASAPMLAGDAFARARSAMLADAAAIPREDRVVELGEASPLRLLDRGEDIAVLQGRLSRAAPVAAPSAFAGWLAGQQRQDAKPVTVHYYGFAGAAGTPPPGVRLVAGYRAPPVVANRGIVALGASPAASGGGGADILVRLIDGTGASVQAKDLRFELDGRRFDPASLGTLGPRSMSLRDVPAAGQLLRVALARGDDFAADDTAAIVLPDRRPVAVAVAPGVPSALRGVVAADPALRLVAPAVAQVVVRNTGQHFGSGLPALEMSDAGTGEAAFAFTDPDGRDHATLARDLTASGATEIDIATLANTLGMPVAAVVEPGPRRGIAVWSQVFAPQTGFAATPAMPLFVARSLRWLAYPSTWIPYARAGAPLPDGGSLAGAGTDPALIRDALNGDIVPAVAGERRLGGRMVAVSLASPATSRAVAARTRGDTGAMPWRRFPDLLFPTLLCAAGILLAFEWMLLTRRRIA